VGATVVLVVIPQPFEPDNHPPAGAAAASEDARPMKANVLLVLENIVTVMINDNNKPKIECKETENSSKTDYRK
jgi:hypothetical protein